MLASCLEMPALNSESKYGTLNSSHFAYYYYADDVFLLLISLYLVDNLKIIQPMRDCKIRSFFLEEPLIIC
jgi:hypothetical protein